MNAVCNVIITYYYLTLPVLWRLIYQVEISLLLLLLLLFPPLILSTHRGFKTTSKHQVFVYQSPLSSELS